MNIFRKKKKTEIPKYESFEEKMEALERRRIPDEFIKRKKSLKRELGYYDNLKEKYIDIYKKLDMFLTVEEIIKYENILFPEFGREDKKYWSFLDLINKYNEMINERVDENYKNKKVEKLFFIYSNFFCFYNEKEFLSKFRKEYDYFTTNPVDDIFLDFIKFIEKNNFAQKEFITDEEYNILKEYIEGNWHPVDEEGLRHASLFKCKISYDNFLRAKKEVPVVVSLIIKNKDYKFEIIKERAVYQLKDYLSDFKIVVKGKNIKL